MVTMTDENEFIAPMELEITESDPRVFYGIEPSGDDGGTGNDN